MPKQKNSLTNPIIRPAAVAGMFYPSSKTELEQMVSALLARTEELSNKTNEKNVRPKAIIVPHAGYVYSGETAAKVYARLKPFADSIKRVVLLGPAHRVGFYGIAAPAATHFETPLGDIPLDQEAMQRALKIEGVFTLDEAHQQEHSLEVQLPFLQQILGNFTLAPFVVGDAPDELTARLLSELWGDDKTLIVISSDLSHFLDYATATQRDAQTAAHIESFEGEKIGPHEACGYHPVRGLLRVARQKDLAIERIALCNSGDTAGDKSRVVGYASYLLH